MNIGIDIDGVLTDLERAKTDFATKMSFEEDWPINLSEYEETKTFNWTEEQAEKFWNKYLVKDVTESTPRAFAQEIIERLQKEGNKIYLITARNESGMPPEYYEKMQQITKK